MKEDPQPRLIESAHTFVLAESNLELGPIFKIDGRTKDMSPYTLQWSGTTDEGSSLTKSWTVEPHAQYGAPRGRDQDVFVAVLTLIDKRGGMPEDGTISTTRSELLRVLGWHDSGVNYRNLRDCLTRIDRTIIASRDAFYHHDTATFLDDSFRLWKVKFRTSQRLKDGRSRETVEIRFADVLIRSYLAGYLKGLDTELYWSLSTYAAKRLYRLVDRMRGRRLEWDEDLFKLQERIPLGPYKYPSKIREKLDPAHAELLEKGFLQQASFDEHSRRMHYRVSPKFARRRETFEVAESSEGLMALEMLGSAGMPVAEAQRLVTHYGPERCLACAQALPFQRNIKKSPLAWLRWAVKETEFDPYPYLRGEKGRVGGDPATEGASRVHSKGEESGSPTQLQLGDSESAEMVQAEPDPHALEVWNEVLKAVQDEINAPSLKVWFQGTVPTSLAGENLTISAPNSFAREYIESRFREYLEAALQAHLSPGATLVVEAHGERDTDNTGESSP